MPIINRIAEFHREMTEWRHDLHAHPELALQETRTSGVVQAKLREFGVDEIITGIARTGVVGVIRGNGGSGRLCPRCRYYTVGRLPFFFREDGEPICVICGTDRILGWDTSGLGKD